MRVEFAPNKPELYKNLLFGVMATGGTTSMAESWEQMRQVGAAARMMLMTAAAARWNVPAGEIKIEKGVISHASGQRATFGELASDAMKMPVPKQVTLKPAKDWQLIGTRVPRLDSPGKTTGSAMFAIDVRRPGMLTAVIKRPEQFGAKVSSFDAVEAEKVDGVVDIVKISRRVAGVAPVTIVDIPGFAAPQVAWATHDAG